MLRTLWIWILQCLGFDPRGIFSFHDGFRWRRVDPMVVARRLWSVSVKQAEIPGLTSPDVAFDMDTSRKLIASGIGSQIQQGYAEISQAVREAFQIPDLEQGGLTEIECDELLGKFNTYLGDVKKNGSGKPISSPSTDSIPAEESATSSESDSGSTSTDSNSGQPESSGLESP